MGRPIRKADPSWFTDHDGQARLVRDLPAGSYRVIDYGTHREIRYAVPGEGAGEAYVGQAYLNGAWPPPPGPGPHPEEQDLELAISEELGTRYLARTRLYENRYWLLRQCLEHLLEQGLVPEHLDGTSREELRETMAAWDALHEQERTPLKV